MRVHAIRRVSTEPSDAGACFPLFITCIVNKPDCLYFPNAFIHIFLSQGMGGGLFPPSSPLATPLHVMTAHSKESQRKCDQSHAMVMHSGKEMLVYG